MAPPIYRCTNGTSIYNLSSEIIPSPILEILSKGLSFIPTSSFNDNNLQFQTNINRILKFSFYNNVQSEKNIHTIKPINLRHLPIKTTPEKINNLHLHTGWSPSIHQVNDSTFNLVNKLHDDFNCKAKGKHIITPNITIKQIKLIKQFFTIYPNLIIKPADKGGVICIINRDVYEKEILRQLSDEKYYKEISESESIKDSHVLRDHILNMFNQGLINQQVFEFILPPSKPTTRSFYGLPKIHKPLEKWTFNTPPYMPKARPIVAAINSETWAISQFLDLHLIPFATKHPSYIKDTQHFLDILSSTHIPENCILLTLDIESLYTNLSHDECIEALHEIFDDLDDPIYPFIIDLIDYCLRHNDFQFGNRLFRQILGTQMGAPFSPELSNLIVSRFEKKLFAMNIKLPKFWKRFLDDVFAIWTYSLEELDNFLDILNSISPFIQFTLEKHHSSIDFLDVTVFKGPLFTLTHRLSTKLFTKDTSSLTLLNPFSHHPKPTFKGIAYGQLLRINRLSSSILDFEKSARKLINTLVSQGYRYKDLLSQYRKVLELRSLKHIQTLNINCSKKCSLCPLLFSIRATDLTLKLPWTRLPPLCNQVHCNLTSCIYVLACQHCTAIYVGQTGNFRNRILNHMSDIRNLKSESMTPHFTLQNPPRITVLQNNIEANKLSYWETFWIHNLGHIYNLLNINIPQTTQILPMVFTFNPHAQEFSKKAIKHISNYTWVPPKKKPKIVLAYRRNTNLKECLVTSNFNKNPRKSITKHFIGKRIYRVAHE